MRELELSDMKKSKSSVTPLEKPKKKKEVDIKKPKPKLDPLAIERKKKKKIKSELKKLEDASLEDAGNVEVERLQASSFDSTRDQVDQYTKMFKKLVRIARIAERKYFKDKQSKDIYALMKVYDQLREVIADMRALQDISEYVDSLDLEVMQPYVQQTAQSLLDLIRAVTQFGDARLSSEDSEALTKYLKNKGKAVGVNLEDAYRSAIENTRRILAG